MSIHFVVANGRFAGRQIPMHQNPFRIGRHQDCHCRPKTSSVSRQHCELRIDEGTLQIRDLRSRNGTYVNDAKIGEAWVELHSQDRIRVGKLSLTVAGNVSSPTSAMTNPADFEDLIAELDHLVIDSEAASTSTETIGKLDVTEIPRGKRSISSRTSAKSSPSTGSRSRAGAIGGGMEKPTRAFGAAGPDSVTAIDQPPLSTTTAEAIVDDAIPRPEEPPEKNKLPAALREQLRQQQPKGTDDAAKEALRRFLNR